MSARAESSGARLRANAARLNAKVVEGGSSLATIDVDGLHADRRDAALLKSMLYESLRWHHRFDRLLVLLLDRPLKPRESVLAALLRVGLTQLACLRIPDHAAVSSTVAACPILRLDRARGLVNAVLRRFVREQDELNLQIENDEVARFSHPEWFIDACRNDWPGEADAILAANNERPPFWLRVNRQRSTVDAYLEQLSRKDIEATRDAAFDDAVLLAEPRAVEDVPGFPGGVVSVQDAAAQRAAGLMALAPGLRVLDACAAPGGKTAHMLERCPTLGELVALDVDTSRLDMIRQTLDRLGLAAKTIAGDALDPKAWFDGRRFDRILVDAPCSATGVIRRHPDIKVLRRGEDLEALAAAQSRMLDALWPLLAPGGRLVYATCSVLKKENTAVVESFADRAIDATVASFPAPDHFQMLPGQANTDGFYYACLSKGGG